VQPAGGDEPAIPRREIRPYFFLSYARTPKRDPADRTDPDRWVHKLYKDLCDEILQMTDAQPGEAGFMDRENKLGAEWSPELMTALKSSRVFVPLYSRRYFESDYCGKEWFAFALREVMLQARDGEAVSAVVPALWTRLDREKIPEVAQIFQYDHTDLGERYRAEGFYGIMKLRNYRGDYQRAVHRLAERIIEIGDRSIAYADSDVQGMERKDFESLPSAFGPASARRTTNDQLKITVLAHDTSTLPPGRASDYYGETPRSWCPYQPGYARPVADYALELAKKCLDYEPLLEAFEYGRSPWNGKGQMPPSLYLVDACVSLSDSYMERLSLLNQASEPWVSILIPWNNQDSGMSTLEKDLREKLREHLGRKLEGVPRRCRMAADGIPTFQDFIQLLPDMTMIMLKRYRKYAPAHPPKGPAIERPRLRRADPADFGDAP